MRKYSGEDTEGRSNGSHPEASPYALLLDHDVFSIIVTGHGPVRSCAAVVKHINLRTLLRADSKGSQADCLPTFFAGLLDTQSEMTGPRGIAEIYANSPRGCGVVPGGSESGMKSIGKKLRMVD